MMQNGHNLIYGGFIALPVAMALLITLAARSSPLTLSVAAWMILGAILARSGILHRFDSIPPPITLFLASGLVAAIVLGMSSWVRGLVALPFSILVGAQSFRILVEVLMHQASTIGLAPNQMTWSGYNFDILTGLTALALAPFASAASKQLVFLWNCLGVVLLIWVVGIAIVSMPTRFQLLRPDNTWVASFPYVWLPTVLVTAALLGHVIVFRKLATKQDARFNPA
jgi:hypothetical protein